MKIIHISDIDITSLGGGMNTVIPELISRQVKTDSNIQNYLLLVNQKHGIKNHHPFPILYGKEISLNFISDADLLIFHSVYNIKFIIYFIYAIFKKVPYIIVSHGGLSKVALQRSRLKKLIFAKLFLNRFVKKALALCFTSLEEQQNSAYTNQPYILVPNPISLLNYPFRLTVEDTQKIHIVYLSKIDFYYKGLDTLFDALELIKEHLTDDISIDIYGYGNNKNIDISHIPASEKDVLHLLSRISKLNLPAVRYHGPVFGDEKMDILRNSDIYILTSRSEAMPLSITEALSVGTPCLVSCGTNMSEMIESNGAGWSTAFSSKDIAHTLVSAINEYKKEPDKFRKAARQLYEKNSSVDIGSLSVRQYKNALNHKI